MFSKPCSDFFSLVENKLKIIALDKTGTITKGEPKVTDIYKINAKDDKELINIAYALEDKMNYKNQTAGGDRL